MLAKNGSITLTDVKFDGCSAQGGDGGGTLSGSTALGGGGGLGGDGGSGSAGFDSNAGGGGGGMGQAADGGAAVMQSTYDKDATVMLNITGGGENRFKNNKSLFYLKPSLLFDIDPDKEHVKSEIDRLY